MKTQYDNYPICHVSREVRDYLRESDKELKRQQTFTEIARREGVTEGAVRNQMRATLEILRQALESQGISRSDFNCPSPYDYTDFYTKNGRRARAKAESAAGQKQAPSQGSGGRDAA